MNQAPYDTERLIKLLLMTTSVHDGEALSAIRLANGLIQKSGKTWHDVLIAKRIPHMDRTRPRPRGPKNAELDAIFKFIMGELEEDSSVWPFVQSVHGFYRRNGRITEKQEAAIRNIHDRLKGASE